MTIPMDEDSRRITDDYLSQFGPLTERERNLVTNAYGDGWVASYQQLMKWTHPAQQRMGNIEAPTAKAAPAPA